MLTINKEIADVRIEKALFFDNAGAMADHIQIEIATNEPWHIAKGTEIHYTDGDFDSGTMYVDEWVQDKNGVTLYARANIPQNKRNWVFKKASLESIVKEICDLENISYTWVGKPCVEQYDYICEKACSGLALIQRLAELENHRIKMESNRLFIVDLEVQGNIRQMEIAKEDGVYSFENPLYAYGVLSYGNIGYARNAMLGQGQEMIDEQLHACNLYTARRWAKGRLCKINMDREHIFCNSNSAVMALDKVYVSGNLARNGIYVADSVTHDVLTGERRIVLGRLCEISI